jgi:hypothetical protein
MGNVIFFAYEIVTNMSRHARAAVDSRADLASARACIGSGRPPMTLMLLASNSDRLIDCVPTVAIGSV